MTVSHRHGTSLILNMEKNNHRFFQHNEMWSLFVGLFEHRMVYSNESFVSFCPCVWQFNMLSGPQIINVLSCTAALIATLWPHTLWLPKATPRPHQVKRSTKIWLKLEWRDTRACDMASGMECSFDAISQTVHYQKYQVCLYSLRLFHGIRNQHYLLAAWMWK